ncbi:hypothetical protein [Bradyrhizobium sp. CCBAU 53351]|nr:hypothetical protein [Bradyrhizobium sp. CCBAU 53351]
MMNSYGDDLQFYRALAQLQTACGDAQAAMRHMLNTLHRKIA